MKRSAEDNRLKLLNFSDIQFLHEFLTYLKSSNYKSLSEIARKLGISREENLHHRLKRVLGRLGESPVINHGISITEEGIARRNA